VFRRVTFRRRSDEEIARYVATGEWIGRSGGYAIQEEGRWFMAERIDATTSTSSGSRPNA
jgi:predicted house-cleaning NTP pyrophosphatase (Maf/HAM1 superfamily)